MWYVIWCIMFDGFPLGCPASDKSLALVVVVVVLLNDPDLFSPVSNHPMPAAIILAFFFSSKAWTKKLKNHLDLDEPSVKMWKFSKHFKMHSKLSEPNFLLLWFCRERRRKRVACVALCRPTPPFIRTAATPRRLLFSFFFCIVPGSYMHYAELERRRVCGRCCFRFSLGWLAKSCACVRMLFLCAGGPRADFKQKAIMQFKCCQLAIIASCALILAEFHLKKKSQV